MAFGTLLSVLITLYIVSGFICVVYLSGVHIIMLIVTVLYVCTNEILDTSWHREMIMFIGKPIGRS